MNETVKHEKKHPKDHKAWTALLWAACIASLLLASACAHTEAAPQQVPADTRAFVGGVISDPARADKVATLMAQLDAEMSAQMKANAETQKEFVKLYADYRTTPEQLTQHLEAAALAREKARARIFDTYFQLKAATSKEEWDVLSGPGKKELTDLLEKTPGGSKEK